MSTNRHPGAAPVVEVIDVTRRFGAIEALAGVSFTVAGPQVLGILGPNGAGKTTLLDLLEGLGAPSSGQVRLFGAPITPVQYPRRRVGVVLQREFVLDGITVAEYADLFASIQGVRGGRNRILGRAHLEDRARTPMARLSGGEAQRLHVAAAVVHDPDLLLLDEPTANLDPMMRLELGRMVRDIGRTRTVVMSTHDLHEAEAVCDRVLFLVAGRVRADGSPADLIEAVPAAERRGRGLEDAFVHFCAGRITARGDLE